MANVLAVLEQRAGTLKQVSHEVLTASRGLADATGASVDAVVIGSTGMDVSTAGTYGAHVVSVVAADALGLYQPDAYAAAVVDRVAASDYRAIVLSATAMGRDLGPRVAARLDCPFAADVTSIDATPELTVTRPVYSGKALYTLEVQTAPCVISLRPNVFTPIEAVREPQVETVAPGETDVRARTVEVKEPESTRLDVAEASVVVSGGRGLKDPQHFNLIEELAAAFGNAAVGASRAVVDAGWRSHADQVGQTGKTVSPQLYIAVGISGAVQHLAGMRTSKVIVAINKDPDAPIFQVADYGVVGDLFEIVPRLTEEIRRVRGG